MSHRPYNQMSFVDQLLTEHQALFELDEVNQLIDWHKFSDILNCIGNPPIFNRSFQ